MGRRALEFDTSLTIAQKTARFSSYMTVENCSNRNYTEFNKVYFRAKMFRFSFYISFVHVHGMMRVLCMYKCPDFKPS